MKHLEIKTPAYRTLLEGFGGWLEALGYSPSSRAALPSHAREFLHWLEENGRIEPAYVSLSDSQRFMGYAAERGHQRKTGEPLSEAHLLKFAHVKNVKGEESTQPAVSVVGKQVCEPRWPEPLRGLRLRLRLRQRFRCRAWNRFRETLKLPSRVFVRRNRPPLLLGHLQ